MHSRARSHFSIHICAVRARVILISSMPLQTSVPGHLRLQAYFWLQKAVAAYTAAFHEGQLHAALQPLLSERDPITAPLAATFVPAEPRGA